MHGHRFLRLQLHPYELELDRFCRERITRANIKMEVEFPNTKLPIQDEPPKLLQELCPE